MAENPQLAARRPRPLSPHLSIYRWPITMAASISHRVTGVGLTVGAAVLAWWLMAAASGPDAYDQFASIAQSVIGRIVLFGFVAALAYHFLNGIRHLFWDIGFGFKVSTATGVSALIYVLTVVLTVAIFLLGYMSWGHL